MQHPLSHRFPRKPSYAQVSRPPFTNRYPSIPESSLRSAIRPQYRPPSSQPPLSQPPDEATRQTAKLYFKIIQAVHHGEVAEGALRTGSFPVGMMRQVNKLTTFIKPASPSETTTTQVARNTHNWMNTNMQILQTHYTHTIHTLTPNTPYNPTAYNIALGWAHKRYTHRLTNATLTRVSNILQIPTQHIQHTQPSTQHTHIQTPTQHTQSNTQHTRIQTFTQHIQPNTQHTRIQTSTQHMQTNTQHTRIQTSTQHRQPDTQHTQHTSDTISTQHLTHRNRYNTHTYNIPTVPHPTPGPSHLGPGPASTRPGLLPHPSTPAAQIPSTVPALLPTPSIPPLLANPLPRNPAIPPLLSTPAVGRPIITPHTVPKPTRSLSLGRSPGAFALVPPRPQRTRPTRSNSRLLPIAPLPPVPEGSLLPAAPAPGAPEGAPDAGAAGGAPLPLPPPSASSTPKITRISIGTDPRDPPKDYYSTLHNMSTIPSTSALSITPTIPQDTPVSPDQSNDGNPIFLFPAGGVSVRRGTIKGQCPGVMMSRLPNGNNRDKTGPSEPTNNSPIPQPHTDASQPHMAPCPPAVSGPSEPPNNSPIPQSHMTLSPPAPAFPCVPSYHKARPKKKVLDWNVVVHKPVAILGDSNVNRIPPSHHTELQIDSYPGATFHHMTKVFEKAEVHPRVEKVILSVGINCKDNDTDQTSYRQLSGMHREAQLTFPNATIQIPMINFSQSLTPTQKNNLSLMNQYISTHFPYIPPIDPRQFHTEPDNIHWTHPTAVTIFKHWSRHLNFL